MQQLGPIGTHHIVNLLHTGGPMLRCDSSFRWARRRTSAKWSHMNTENKIKNIYTTREKKKRRNIPVQVQVDSIQNGRGTRERGLGMLSPHFIR